MMDQGFLNVSDLIKQEKPDPAENTQLIYWKQKIGLLGQKINTTNARVFRLKHPHWYFKIMSSWTDQLAVQLPQLWKSSRVS